MKYTGQPKYRAIPVQGRIPLTPPETAAISATCGKKRVISATATKYSPTSSLLCRSRLARDGNFSQTNLSAIGETERPTNAFSVIFKMMCARGAHDSRGDNGAARRFSPSTSCRTPRHRVKEEVLVNRTIRRQDRTRAEPQSAPSSFPVLDGERLVE